MTTESVPKWRRLEPDQRREQIFTCAAELFGERPYADVSTSDIAARAGVARGLINHYFGTKRELYLAVVRRALNLPYGGLARLPAGSTEERVKAAVDWFLDLVGGQEKMWLAAITPEGIGRDVEVERILDEADRNAADRVLQAMGFEPTDPRWEQFNAVVRAYSGMVKVAGREWLMRGTLDRAQVHALLSHVLESLVTDVLPELSTT
ncbi:TetR/AcrR family transcriptional regulator [Saccharomonospora azurea]|uniref:Transcriptional regulator n=1 Tax=Saccharomonospora azurea NA-128 TaxID=882081 RepID=H8GF16_9PSEU|nr:TetR/AcrR family transcriptional regulator [Saccharomonospora azurea]EHK86120.1 transcriptional regulator [Saccharomonospora azurea SZMC 14600]EHY91047.1 transcriptional regulator [Saccharomonospora azurea NA-128]